MKARDGIVVALTTEGNQALEDKAQSRANLANLSFALAGAFGIASGVMYWRARNLESSLQVVPVAEGTGASVVVGGQF